MCILVTRMTLMLNLNLISLLLFGERWNLLEKRPGQMVFRKIRSEKLYQTMKLRSNLAMPLSMK